MLLTAVARFSSGGVAIRYNISGFMDDIIFAHNGHYGGMCMSLQRVALLRRHAQANAPAASYWFRRVLDEKVLGAEPAMPHCFVCRVFFLVFVTFAYINLYSPKIR